MARKRKIHYFALSILSFIYFIAGVQSQDLCPELCVCDIWYELQRASCTGRHLYSIHAGVPNTVQALDLSNNSISSLLKYELEDAGLYRVKYLNLSGNSISEIGLSAFNGLVDLTVLDLSRNHLYYVLPDVFAESKKLRILKLSKNNFDVHIPRLLSYSLTELSLDSCQISHLPSDVFNGLPHLRKLDISSNLLIQMDSAVVHKLYFLRVLLLDRNPWICNKAMHDLKVYLTHKNIEFHTKCFATQVPRKSEKMIIAPITKWNHRHTVAKNAKIGTVTYVTNNTNSDETEKKNSSISPQHANNDSTIIKPITDMSPYWFFIVGFMLGCASTLFISYIWLKGIFSCRGCRHSERSRNGSQRLSLLSNLWQFEDFVQSDNADSTCPGTPPPPYRDVVLRPGLYRFPTNGTNLNNNDTGCREEYT